MKTKIMKAMLSIFILIIGVFSVYFFTKKDMKNVQSKDKKNNHSKPVIILDAGHDHIHGGCYRENTNEEEITLKFAKKLGKQLEKRNIQVVYTREDEQALDQDRMTCLQKRAEFSKKYQADYFISLHVNSLDNMQEARGYEIYTIDKYKDSIDLANVISYHMDELDYLKKRFIRDGSDLRVLRLNTAIPILIELGYITGNDFYYLTDDQKIEEISLKICEGIVEKIKKEKE